MDDYEEALTACDLAKKEWMQVRFSILPDIFYTTSVFLSTHRYDKLFPFLHMTFADNRTQKGRDRQANRRCLTSQLRCPREAHIPGNGKDIGRRNRRSPGKLHVTAFCPLNGVSGCGKSIVLLLVVKNAVGRYEQFSPTRIVQ